MHKTNKKPLVSVIMPAYNARAYIAEAIESIVGQTYKNLELIIVNDKSTDDTLMIAKRMQRKYPDKIRVVNTRMQTNAAGNGAMNYGLKYSKGEFVARMDADDIAFPTRIEKQVAFMQKKKTAVVVGSQALVVDENGKVTGAKNMPIKHKDIYEQYGVFHPMIHPTVMFRRSALSDPNNIYAMRFDVNDDYFTFFELLSRGRFYNIDEPLLYYRIHGKNLSLNDPKAKFINSVKIRLAAVSELGYQMSAKAWVLMVLQMALILPMPESWIVPLYMLVRGIKRPQISLDWNSRIVSA